MSHSTDSLIDLYFDGRASSQDAADLAERIASDPQAAAEFVRACRMQSALEQHFEQAADRREARIDITSIVRKRGARDRKTVQRARRRATMAHFWHRPAVRLAGAGALAAILVIALLPPGSGDSDADSSGLARAEERGEHSSPLAYEPAKPALLPANKVQHKLGRFFLPALSIEQLPIEDALAELSSELEDVALRHADAEVMNLALRLEDKLTAGDPRRLREVSLHSGSIAAADALQLLAGQAGLRVAFVDGGARLHPRPLAASGLRQRSFEVPADFLERVASIIPGEATEANPLAALSYQPPASASAYLKHGDDGTALLTVRALADDLRSISRLTSMMEDRGNSSVALNGWTIELSAESMTKLALAASGVMGHETEEDAEMGDLISALFGNEPADRIISERSEFKDLAKLLRVVAGRDFQSLPAVDALVDQTVHLSSQSPNQPNVQALGILGERTYLTTKLVESSDAPEPATDSFILSETSFPTGLEEIKYIDLPTPTTSETITGGRTIDTANNGLTLSFSLSEAADAMATSRVDRKIESSMMARLEGEAVRLTGALRVAAVAAINTNHTHWGFILEEVDRLDSGLVPHTEGAEGGAYVNALASFDESLRTIDSFAQPAESNPVSILVLPSPEDIPVVVSIARTLENPALPVAQLEREVVDFDATIAPGQTLLLEMAGENGGKKLVFVTAEKQ